MRLTSLIESKPYDRMKIEHSTHQYFNDEKKQPNTIYQNTYTYL